MTRRKIPGCLRIKGSWGVTGFIGFSLFYLTQNCGFWGAILAVKSYALKSAQRSLQKAPEGPKGTKMTQNDLWVQFTTFLVEFYRILLHVTAMYLGTSPAPKAASSNTLQIRKNLSTHLLSLPLLLLLFLTLGQLHIGIVLSYPLVPPEQVVSVFLFASSFAWFNQ